MGERRSGDGESAESEIVESGGDERDFFNEIGETNSTVRILSAEGEKIEGFREVFV